MNEIIISAGSLGALGVVFGLILWIASKTLSVEVDPRQSQIRDVLPSANCGGCGYAGCDAYAAAIVEGKANINDCPVGGAAVVAKVAQIMGVNSIGVKKMIATVKCRGGLDRCKSEFDYSGYKDCRAAVLAGGGDKACKHSCLGLSTCERACPFGAITMNEQRIAVVDENKCTGCKKCVAVCPRDIMVMMPVDQPVHSTCNAMEKGKVVRDHCTAGCIGCAKCAKVCKFSAIAMKNNLPIINYVKCTGCMQCAENCPTGALAANENLRKRAIINISKCDGCNKCFEVCKFEAIGQKDKKHTVVAWNCVGCGECVENCHTNCISMYPATKLNIK